MTDDIQISTDMEATDGSTPRTVLSLDNSQKTKLSSPYDNESNAEGMF